MPVFKLVIGLTAPWPVKWRVVDESGAVVETRLSLNLTRIGQSEFEELFGTAGGETRADIAAHNRKLFDRVVRGWSAVVDDGGAPVSFCPDAVDLLLEFPGFAGAFGEAYARFWAAIPEGQI